jgi:outer membrane protein assembly factor BamB
MRLLRGALLIVLVLVAAGCDWPQFGFSSSGGRFNPSETAIGVGNVEDLKLAWSSNVGGSSPVVANGIVYIGSGADLFAFDATGSRRCSPAPKSCVPLWRGTTGVATSTPAVANGVVYVLSDVAVGSGTGRLYAFDAAGTTGCSGSPSAKTCTPLWTATTAGGGGQAPVFANGVVYVGSGDGNLYAFDASGTTNCSGTPKTCAPLWTGPTGGVVHGPPAVTNGVVYLGSEFLGGTLVAFDASGTTNCSGTPKTCDPLWTGFPGDTPPAVVNGLVYIGSEASGDVSAFDARGITGCFGTPKTCEPLWTTTLGGRIFASTAVAHGVVYTAPNGLDFGENVVALDASTGSPIWSTDPTPDGVLVLSSPAVANGVVYNTSGNNVYAYDAATGAPLWSASVGTAVQSPTVANGYLYVSSGTGLFAFTP